MRWGCEVGIKRLKVGMREMVLMKEEYDIENMNPRKNPYSKRLEKQININIDSDTIDFFKEQSEKVRYQTPINLDLSCCARNKW